MIGLVLTALNSDSESVRSIPSRPAVPFLGSSPEYHSVQYACSQQASGEDQGRPLLTDSDSVALALATGHSSSAPPPPLTTRAGSRGYSE